MWDLQTVPGEIYEKYIQYTSTGIGLHPAIQQLSTMNACVEYSHFTLVYSHSYFLLYRQLSFTYRHHAYIVGSYALV